MMLGWLRRWLGGGGVSEQASAHLWVVSAPSGAGKTSLVRELCRRRPQLVMSCSYTTRSQRPNEVDGRDYFFIDRERFREMAAAGEFLEHAEVFGNCYATGRDHVTGLLQDGHNVVLEIDWQGARQVREALPSARTIFILPPSYAELERRLRGRGSDAEDVIQRRLAEACDDMGHWSEFDYVVINDEFDAAANLLESILDGHGAEAAREDPALRARIAAIIDVGAEA
ncbi:MAG: guanylate kinase [Gammaproteobacteria bacterium]|nr:guanylate kinase [Gammaproteobacteria bacterium]